MYTYRVEIEMETYGFTCILKSIQVKSQYIQKEGMEFLYQDGAALYYREITKINEDD